MGPAMILLVGRNSKRPLLMVLASVPCYLVQKIVKSIAVRPGQSDYIDFALILYKIVGSVI